jgi:hypothetical protein
VPKIRDVGQRIWIVQASRERRRDLQLIVNAHQRAIDKLTDRLRNRIGADASVEVVR